MTATYYIAVRNGTVAHHDRDCHALAHADSVGEIAAGDSDDFCQYCRPDPDDDSPVPAATPCPCGGGDATLRSHSAGERPGAVNYHYKHADCPLGGTLVTVDETVIRRVGPVFQPERFDATRSYGGVAGD